VQNVCIHIYLELVSPLGMQPATLKFYVHHAVLKCENGTDVIVKGLDMACPYAHQTVPLVVHLNVCMHARYWPAKFQEN